MRAHRVWLHPRVKRALAVLTLLLTTLPGAPPAAGTPPRYNVVEWLLDDASADDPAHMPYLRSMPGVQWFDNARDEVPVCAPARISLLTGQSSYEHHVENVVGPMDGRNFADGNSLATWLHDSGVHTSLLGKYCNGYGETWRADGSKPPGWDDWHAYYGYPDYYNYRLTDGHALTSYGAANADYSTDVLTRLAINQVRSAPAPFYVGIHVKAPHRPLQPPARYLHTLDTVPVPHNPSFREADVSDKPAYIRGITPNTVSAYNTETRRRWETERAVDDGIRALDQALADTGHLKDTVVMFLSDNGWSEGEHRWRQKLCPYEQCDKVFLGVRVPGRPGGHHRGLVSVTDIAPTVADLAGAPRALPGDGVSFAPTLFGGTEPARLDMEAHWIGGGPSVSKGIPPRWRALITADGWKYIRYLNTGEVELYDLNADPYELQNQHGNPAYGKKEAELQARLAAKRTPSQSYLAGVGPGDQDE